MKNLKRFIFMTSHLFLIIRRRSKGIVREPLEKNHLGKIYPSRQSFNERIINRACDRIIRIDIFSGTAETPIQLVPLQCLQHTGR